jgi:hypothetical protein
MRLKVSGIKRERWRPTLGRRGIVAQNADWRRFRIRTERRCGELLKEMEKAGTRHDGRGSGSNQYAQKRGGVGASDSSTSQWFTTGKSDEAADPNPQRLAEDSRPVASTPQIAKVCPPVVEVVGLQHGNASYREHYNYRQQQARNLSGSHHRH